MRACGQLFLLIHRLIKKFVSAGHRNPKGEMKPLNKLEKEMFEARTGWPHEEAKRSYGKEPLFATQEEEARRCAKVAVDLAKRTWDGATDMNYPDRVFTEFLKSEGIETEN